MQPHLLLIFCHGFSIVFMRKQIASMLRYLNILFYFELKFMIIEMLLDPLIQFIYIIQIWLLRLLKRINNTNVII